jgi:tRNA-2-methylthio-N6-dimethylallyladenosine synthase
VLLGQTVNSYGRDFIPRRRFAELLESLSAIEGLDRIRFTSPHPQEVREDFIELIARNPKICRHIHMPLQSGSDRVLKLMNRNYRRQRYLEIIDALRARVPEIAITTDIIVGFPGETEQDFCETLSVLEHCRFQDSFSFVFSPRPGTAAAAMEDPVSHCEKLERLKRLQSRQFEMSTEALQAWVGKTAEVLIEAPSAADPERLSGRLSQNITLNFEEPDASLRPGMIVPALVREAAKFTLRGVALHSRADAEPVLGQSPVNPA